MRYQVIITRPARQEMRKVSALIRQRLEEALDALADDPFPHGAERVKSYPDAHRIRVGDYRVIYTVVSKEIVILVLRIGHRREVYR